MDSLKKFLSESEMTQTELAVAVDVSQPTISDWVNGRVTPTVDNLFAISRATGIPVEKLLKDLRQTA